MATCIADNAPAPCVGRELIGAEMLHAVIIAAFCPLWIGMGISSPFAAISSNAVKDLSNNVFNGPVIFPK